jgi:hypothetical protein
MQAQHEDGSVGGVEEPQKDQFLQWNRGGSAQESQGHLGPELPAHHHLSLPDSMPAPLQSPAVANAAADGWGVRRVGLGREESANEVFSVIYGASGFGKFAYVYQTCV